MDRNLVSVLVNSPSTIHTTTMLSSQETCAAIYKQLFTDAEWQIIDYALSEYQDHLDEDDNEIAIFNSIQAKLNAIFTLTDKN